MLGGGEERIGRACLDKHYEHENDGNNLCARPECGAKYHPLGPFGGYWTPRRAVC